MTLLDDDIDDLLHAFRADEALLDDSTRTRMWARICDDVPDAPAALDALGPPASVRRLRSPANTSPRILAIAAVVLALLAVAAIALRSGPGDNAVTAGSVPSGPLPQNLQELADAVAVTSGPELGSSPESRYSHLVTQRVSQGSPSSEERVYTEERWIARDGAGRLLITGDEESDDSSDDPDHFRFGSVPPRVLLDLPDDPDALVDALVTWGIEVDDAGAAQPVVEMLAHAGLPGPARAALIRYLDRLGYRLVTEATLGSTLWRVEGPGPDGSTLQADLDRLTGVVTASLFTSPQGIRDQRTYTIADLRGDRGR
jgi:hypothetical protein